MEFRIGKKTNKNKTKTPENGYIEWVNYYLIVCSLNDPNK